MIVVFKMTPEKKEKYGRKLDKMMEFLEEFKECLEDAEEYGGDDEWEETPQYRNSMRRAMRSSMKSRYSRKGEDY
jgi:hypothetical protein